MNETLLFRFVELVKHDQQINDLEKSIDKLQDDVAYHEEEIRKLKENLETTQQYKRDMHKLVDEKELYMKELDERERAIKQRLNQAKNNREFDSLQREVALLQKEQTIFEKELLETWKNYEEAQRIYSEKKEYVKNHIEKFDALIYEKMQKIKELEDQVKLLYDERPEKTENISEEMLKKYATMRTQISNPVVPLDRGSCSACFHAIPEYEILSIERGALKQCKMCFRFLYSDVS